MLRCASAALFKNTIAAAIARPARNRCQRRHRERKRSSLARVLTVAQGGAREPTLEKRVRAPAPSTTTVKIYFATAVPETANSSAWNHIVNFRRRDRDGRRSRKLLPLCHTQGSAPRSPCLPRQTMDQWTSSKLEQNYGISCKKN